MKKKVLCVFLVSSVILGNCNVYANAGSNGAASDKNSTVTASDDETVSSQAVIYNFSTGSDETAVTETAEDETASFDVAEEKEDTTTSDSALTAMATDKNFATITLTDNNDSVYELTVKYDAVYTSDAGDEVCCQVIDISKDISCDVVIPPTLDIMLSDGSKVTRKVRFIAANAFEASKITSITLPETVREIGDNAFLNCTNLKTANIKAEIIAGTTSINDNNEEVFTIDPSNITNGVTVTSTIGNNVFQGCTALQSARITGFQKIGNYLFSGCSSLTSAEFSTDGMYKVTKNSVTTTELTMTIGTDTFSGCSALANVTLGKNITTIGANTFMDCISLDTVNIGPNLKSTFGVASFSNCPRMRMVNVDSANTTFSSVNGVLYKGSSTKPTALEYLPPLNPVEFRDETGALTSEIGTLILPESVSSVTAKAAQNNCNLKQLIAPSSITINSSAFTGCNNLTSVTAQSTATIKESAFEALPKLNDVHLLKKADVGANAFKNCGALTTLEHSYNEGTSGSKIGTSAFEGCSSLRGLKLCGWASISATAFKDCTSITEVTIVEGVGDIGNNCFEGCIGIKTADLTMAGFNVISSASSFTFGSYIFKDCTGLENAELPYGLQGISSGTFQGCTALTKVTAGDNTGSICSYAFEGCTSLIDPPSPRFLVRIDEYAFKDCTALADYSLTRSVLIIHDTAFENCNSLVINAPDGSRALEYAVSHNYSNAIIEDDILDEEFLVCSGNKITGYRGGFESLTIPADFFTKRGISADSYIMTDKWIDQPLAGSTCSMKNYLKSIDLGPVTVIYSNALANSVLTQAYLGNAEYIGASAFANCKSLLDITIPSSVKVMSNSVFNGCTALTKATFAAPIVSSDIVDTEGDLSIPVIDSVDNISTIQFKTFSLDKNDILTVAATDSTAIFNGCTALETVEFMTTPIKINSTNTEQRNKIKEVSNISLLPVSCFSGCTGLTTIAIPYNCKTISKSAFKNCKALVNLRFGILTEAINELAFENCTALKDITFPHYVVVGKNAFKGCTNIENITIPQTVKLAISNTPFVDTKKATIKCDELANNATYFQAFNDPEANAELFSSASDVAKYAKAGYEYNIEIREFNEGVDYVSASGKVTIPDGVTVTKANGTKLNNGDFVLTGDELTITSDPALGTAARLTVNGEVFTSGSKYIVTEKFDGSVNDVVIALEMISPCTLSIAEGAKVVLGNTELKDGAIVSTGDKLVISIIPIETEARSLRVNGEIFKSGSEYTIPEGTQNVAITVESVKYGTITLPSNVTAKIGDTELKTGDYIHGGDQITFGFTPSVEDEKLLVNGKIFNAANVYTAVLGENIVITTEVVKGILGDVNYDLTVTANDAALVLQHALTPNFDDNTISLADVNGDGTITATDAAAILQKALDNTYLFDIEK